MPAPQPRDKSASVTVTARHMADAVEYLARVAREAGLRRIACRLTNVQANLLNVAAGVPEARVNDESEGTEGQGHGRH